MLPIKNRLKKREDFAKIFSKGAYAGANDLSIKYLSNEFSDVRIGFPVGKNYSKKAVARNRVRRVLRTACTKYLNELKPGYDIIVMIKPSYQNVEMQNVIGELKKVFSKANLFTKNSAASGIIKKTK